jgi:nucleoside-diphosphate kinase
MVSERTLSIIKPEWVIQNKIDEIYRRFAKAGLKIIAAQRMQLTQDQAKRLYAVHKNRTFFPELVKYITSKPVMVQVLEGQNAVARYRALMGATNPVDAQPGTLRAEFGQTVMQNAVHGSDSLEAAAYEIRLFFPEMLTKP